MTIAVYARPIKDHSKHVETIFSYLKKEGVKLIIHNELYVFLRTTFGYRQTIETFADTQELVKQADYLVCLGGDGTMLETLSLVRKSGVPILGVNTGRLGFLSSVYKEDLEKALNLLINEKFSLDKRELIKLKGCGDCFGDMNYALNEFAIHKKDSSSMINIDTYVDGIFLNTYFADGIIVSTPTGSTAYSLSCGGPIMMPDSDNFIITPIAPHNLSVRPMVISNNKEIRFKVSGRGDGVFNVTLDSRTAQIQAGTELHIRKAHFRLNLINLEGQHFFSTLRNKLMWGVDKRQ